MADSHPKPESATDSKPSAGSATWRTRSRGDGSAPAQKLGRFEIIAALGKGAFGEVWKAYDPNLDREVALKIPRFDDNTGKEAERFFREARAAGQLKHPNIVAIHDAGEAEGQYYIASTFIDGSPLSVWLKENTPSFEQTAEIIRKLAEALHYAHSQGIFHRDIKPANVMIDREGEPHLMDFGLARRLDQEASMTTEGAILGTPSYMSPEQAKGQSRAADARSDLYSLGVVLYEMLAGKRPFDGPPPVVLHKVIHEEAESPRRVNATVPLDLEVIALKCLSKEPERRYPSAQHLADELRRWLNREPIQARAAGKFEKAFLWAKRNPLVAALSGVAVLALFTLTLLSTAFAIRERSQGAALQRETEAAEQSRNEALARFRESERRLALNNLERGTRECDRGQVAQGLLWMARALRSSIAAEDSELEWAVRTTIGAWREQVHPLVRVLPNSALVQSMALSRDGSRLALGLGNGELIVWDPNTGEVVRAGMRHAGAVFSVEFSADGQTLLSGSMDRTACLWDLRTGERIGAPFALPGIVVATFGLDDKTIVTMSHEAVRLNLTTKIQAWDVATRKEIGTAETAANYGYVVFNPDKSRYLLVKGMRTAPTKSPEPGTAQIFDSQTRRPIGTPMIHAAGIQTAAFSPNGRQILTGSHDKTARLWDAATGQPIGSAWHHEDLVGKVAFAPNGKIAITLSGARVRFWDVETGQPIHRPGDLQGQAIVAVFSPNGEVAMTGGTDFNGHIWDTSSGRAVGGFLPQGHEVQHVVFSHDGGQAVTAGRDGSVRIWQVKKPVLPTMEPANGPRSKRSLISQNGTVELRFDQQTQLARAFDPKTNEPLGPAFGTRGMRRNELGLSADGSVCLTCSVGEMNARLWRMPSGQPIGLPLNHGDEVSAVALSPDGRLAATTTLIDRSMRPNPSNNLVRLWSTATSLPVGPPLRWKERGAGIMFSADGKTLRHYHEVAKLDEAWRMPEPILGDIRSVEKLIQTLTGMQLEESGAMSALNAADWNKIK